MDRARFTALMSSVTLLAQPDRTGHAPQIRLRMPSPDIAPTRPIIRARSQSAAYAVATLSPAADRASAAVAASATPARSTSLLAVAKASHSRA